MLRDPNSDEDLPIRHMVMVYEESQAALKGLLESLKQRDLSLFEKYDFTEASVAEQLDKLIPFPGSVDIRSIEAWEIHVRGCVNIRLD